MNKVSEAFSNDIGLCLHVDASGRVWAAWWGQHGLAVTTVRRFSANPLGYDVPMETARTIRVLGVPVNARLITALREFHLNRTDIAKTQSVWLGGPQSCPCGLESPQTVLWSLRQMTPTQVSAGWHRLGGQDFATYALIAEIEAFGRVTEKARRILPYHPAWPALSFDASVDLDAACRLIALIIDPRWFRHPIHPGRLSRLYEYLGLTPQTIRAVACGSESGRHGDRARTVLAVWPHALDNDAARPASFLHRIVDASSDGAGVLRATRQLIRFLVEVWLSETISEHEVSFVASRFFSQPDECTAYRGHCEALKLVT